MIDYQNIINHYKSYFGDSDVPKRLIQQLLNNENVIDRKNMHGHMTGDAIIFNNNYSKVVVIYHKTLQKYVQPGGHIDDIIDQPWIHALREAKEETGIQNVILHPWHEQHFFCPINIQEVSIKENPIKQEGKHHHYNSYFVFLAPEGVLGTDDDGVSHAHRELIENLSEEMKNRISIIKKRLE